VATFEQHVNTTVIAIGIIITPLHSAGILDVSQSLGVLILGLIGGLLPDLDSDNSKPLQILFKMLSIFFPLVVLLSISAKLPIVQMIVIWLVSSYILHLTLFKFFLKLTVHRGIFHSIPMGILFWELTVIIFHYMFNVNIIFSNIAGVFIFLGFLIHLLLDEFISLNALGLRIKRSFGTAFKFYSKNNKSGTTFLYIIIVILYIFAPINNLVFYNIIEVLIDSDFI